MLCGMGQTVLDCGGLADPLLSVAVGACVDESGNPVPTKAEQDLYAAGVLAGQEQGAGTGRGAPLPATPPQLRRCADGRLASATWLPCVSNSLLLAAAGVLVLLLSARGRR